MALVLYGTIPFTWFKPAERSLVVSVAVQSNYAGWCLGSVLIPRMVKRAGDFNGFILVQAVVVTFNVVLFALFYRERPAEARQNWRL